jgi:hypothetical protein
MALNFLFVKKLNLQGFTLFCCCFLIVGLIFSPFVLSLGIWGLVLSALWHLNLENAIETHDYSFNFPIFIKNLKTGIARFYAQKADLPLVYCFFW